VPARHLARLFPPGVVTVAARQGPPDAPQEPPQFPEEEERIGRAVPSRRAEFRCGRRCAREALGRLGVEPVAIPSGPDRAPQWPPGIVGSLSHCDGLCAAVVARRGRIAGLGLDIESAEPLDVELIRRICTPAEAARLDPTAPGFAAKLAFSAKEAVYKCLYPSVRRLLPFHAVEIRLDLARGCFEADLPGLEPGEPPPGRLRGRIRVAEGYVWCGAAWLGPARV